MNVAQIKNLLNAEMLTDAKECKVEIEKVFACDLMSDVLALVEEETALLTGLINIQTIRTADMKDIGCIIFVRGKRPDENTIELAESLNITLLSTNMSLFNACGILYNAGVRGIEL